MDFSFLGIRLRLGKVREIKRDISLKDVAEVNGHLCRYLKSLAGDEIQSRISSVSFSNFSDLTAIKKTIEENGIVIIPGFVPNEAMQELRPLVEEIEDRIDLFINSEETSSDGSNVLLQKGTAKLSGYQRMASYGKSVVQVRMGQDEGMIDIFNVDKWFGEIGRVLRPFFDSPEVSSILQSGVERIEARNLNFYINRNITKTRGFHVDSYGKQLKGFVYLTDVLSLDDGPYTYVKGSHFDSAFRRINKQISSVLPNNTESPVVSLDDIIPVLAPKGALVISDQGGVHRGFPQAEGHERAIAVMNYK